ncbi:MAG: helix-turn-helix domain-containing protein [Pseudomonadota bacterium]
MENASMVGTRIRERRIMVGIKQADLAQSAGISASYLNLIEHNRRRIGGKTLHQLAEVLDVTPAFLSQGAEVALLSGLRDAAEDHTPAETDRVDEFAGRFPGWAGLILDLVRQRDDLAHSVKALTDRIAYDPELAKSLHEVISTVTSIRSAATILADGQSLEPQWQSRFHRNIDEDSERLASEAEALVRYLEGAPGSEMAVRTPLEQFHAFMESHDHHFSELEGPGGSARVTSIIARGDHLVSDAARQIAFAALEQYVQDARRLPLSEMGDLIETHGLDPLALAEATNQRLATVARRLGSLPEDVAGPVGFFICDGTGRVILQKPALGIARLRTNACCIHWPIYEVLGHPGRVIQKRVRQDEARVIALAMSHEARAASVDRPAFYHAQMLILPDNGTGPETKVAASCSMCTMGACQVD